MPAQEYWRFDRRGEHYGEPLVGERLVDGQYQRFELHTDANGDIWSRSEVLGVDFVYRLEEGVNPFHVRDSATGEWLNPLWRERRARQEEVAARQQAEDQAQQERRLRIESGARKRELRAEIERLRSQQT